MLSPMLFIGVGGSGGNTVRTIRENLQEALRLKGWTGEFPECWQTLWIDTIAVQGTGGFGADLLPHDSYLGLVQTGLQYPDIRDDIKNQVPATSHVDVLSGWLPERSPVPIEKGAGQYRALGRAIGVDNFRKMRLFLESANARLTNTQALTDIAKLNALFNQPQGSKKQTTSVFVISSMAGGSGSGLFQDVAHMVKLIDPGLANFTHVMLYGADVFKLGIPDNMLRSVPGNTTAALAETINGGWREALTPQSEFLFNAAGFNTNSTLRYGGKHNWIIGASNNEASLGKTTDEIYRAVGSSLAALTLSSETLEWLNNYVITNVFPGSATGLNDNTRLKISGNPDHFQPFSSMGFSRVTLGMDRFKDYAAEAVTKSAVKQLLWPDYEPSDSNQDMSNHQKITVKADQLWLDFLTKSGLKERNPSNDVLDALKPKDDNRIGEFATQAVENAGGGTGGHDASTWQARVMKFFNENVKQVLDSEKSRINQAAQDWVIEVQDKILNATAEVAGIAGYRVAQELVKRLRMEVDFLVKTELPSDALKARKRKDEISAVILKLLSTGKSKISKGEKEIDNVRETLKKGTSFLTEADRIDIAIELLADLDANFLTGLQKELSTSLEMLKISAGDQKNGFSNFPSLEDVEVQSRFAPPTTEQSLIDFKLFPQLLSQWSQEVLDSSTAGSWRERLVERTIRGINFDQTGDSQSQSLITLEPRWMPKNSDYRKQLGSPQTANHVIISDVVELRNRARKMINSRAGTLSDHVNMGIRPYLDNISDPKEKQNRQIIFNAAVNAAVKYCAPMVFENPGVLAAVHPKSSALERYISFSTVPLGNLQGEKAVIEAVRTAEPQNTLLNKVEAFNADDAITAIEFYSVLNIAKNPVVFDSLMQPLSSEWNSMKSNEDERLAFWTLRRTKPLAESIPLASELIEQAITGWFALVFTGGRVIERSDLVHGPKVSVFSKRKSKMVDFPHPLLGLRKNSEDHDLLPSALTSLIIALTEVNSTKSIDPLDAYHAIIDAGSTDKILGYHKLIDDYVKKSSTEKGIEQAQIRTQLQTAIDGSKDYFEKLFTQINAHGNPFTVPPIFEIRNSVLDALTKLRDVSGHPIVEAGEGVVTG